MISRGYGHPQDKDSGGSDDDMSDEGPDDMLPSTSRDRLDASGMIFVRFLNRVSRIYKAGLLQLLSHRFNTTFKNLISCFSAILS